MIVVSLLAALAGAGCTDDNTRPIDRPGGAAATTAACPNQDSATSEGEVIGGPEQVDVDGDGADEEITLYLDRASPSGCQAFLVVAGDAEIIEPVWTIGETVGLPQPSLFGFSDLDSDGGFEIVINEASGASTQFVAAYKVEGDRIVPLELPDSTNGLFGFGGSVGHVEAVDCSADGAILVSQAVPADVERASDDPLYSVTRRTYRIEGTELVRVDVERREMPITRLAEFQEFEGGPFSSCPAP